MSEASRHDRTHRGRTRLAGLAALIVVALLVIACGSGTTSSAPSIAPTPTTPPTAAPSAAATTQPSAGTATADAIYAEIERQVAEIRGLDAKRDVPRQFITSTELRGIPSMLRYLE